MTAQSKLVVVDKTADTLKHSLVRQGLDKLTNRVKTFDQL